ncbi:MAG: Ig-like domain-containing protein, partial [Chloroflexota bacterium]
MTGRPYFMPWGKSVGICLLTVLFIGNSNRLLAESNTRAVSQMDDPLQATLVDQTQRADGKADIGDIIEYEAQLSYDQGNSVPAEDVNFQLDLDTALTLAGDIDTTPLAYADTYFLQAEDQIEVPAEFGVLQGSTDGAIIKQALAADQDFDLSPGVEVIAESITTDKGEVELLADGSFIYTHLSGESDYTDGFTYTIIDAEGNTDQAEVTLVVESQKIIFVDNQSDTSGNGSLDLPYQSLDEALAAANNECDVIFLFSSSTPYTTESIALKNCQKIIGQDYGPYDFEALTDLDEEVPNASGQNRPVISCSRSVDYLDGVNPSQFFPTTSKGCITLAQNNLVAGINIDNPDPIQKAIAGQNVGSFWGFNLTATNSDGFSISCNDDQLHTIKLSDDVSVQNFGFTGLDAVAFQNEVNDSGLNCALNLDVSSFSVANGQSDSAEAIY